MSTTNDIHDVEHKDDGIIVDSDVHFTIDTTTRAISNQNGDKTNKKLTIMQYDNKSERYSFDIDKVIDGHDLTLCNRVQVHFINIGSNKEKTSRAYTVTDVHENPDDKTKISFSWLISNEATQYNGTLNFLITFECIKDGNILYRWSSSVFEGIRVVAGMRNEEELLEIYSDELIAWQNSMETELLPKLVNQCYIKAEFASSDDVAGIFNMTAPVEVFDEFIEDASVSNDVLTLFKNDGSTFVFDTAATLKENLSKPNLLVNGDFRVNQRGAKTYSQRYDYAVDKWQMSFKYGIVVINDDASITHTPLDGDTTCQIRQFVEKCELLSGKTVTVSIDNKPTGSFTLYLTHTKVDGTASTIGIVNHDNTNREITVLTRTLPTINKGDKIEVILTANTSACTYYSAKLEIGSTATPFSPKSYEEELAACQVVENGVSSTYSHPNLLINGDFRVNQRNFTSLNLVTGSKGIYTVDRWRMYSAHANYTTSLNSDNTITVDNTNGATRVAFAQYIDEPNWKMILGKNITLSVKIDDQLVIATGLVPAVHENSRKIITTATMLGYNTTIELERGSSVSGRYIVNIWVGNGEKHIIKYAKLEIGSTATQLVTGTYEEELALCQRYYQQIYLQACDFGTTEGSMCPLISLPVTMRTLPTIDTDKIIHINGNGSYIGTAVSYQISLLRTNGVVLYLEHGGITAAIVYGIFCPDLVTLDAEIY